MVFNMMFAILLSAPAQAGIVHAPASVLGEIRSFMGSKSFAETLACGTESKLKRFVSQCTQFECSDEDSSSGGFGMCMTVCAENPGTEEIWQVVNCAENSADIFNPDTGDLTTVEKTTFENSGNMPLTFLEILPQFTNYLAAHVYIERTQASEYTLSPGTPTERRVPALHLFGKFGEEKKHKLDLVATIVANQPGIGQVARLRLDSKTWFLLKEAK